MRTALLMICALLMSTGTAWAQSDYDLPISLTNVQALPYPSQMNAIRCTVFADLVAWEIDVDTPGPTLSLIRRNGPLPPCGSIPPPGQLIYQSVGLLVGRRGPFLLVAHSEGTGYNPFSIVAASGKILYTDNTIASTDFPITELEGGALRLRFTRTVPADCSLMTNAATCWAQLISKGDIPRVLAVPVPSAAVCTPTYLQGNAPAEDPSIVTYDVDMLVSSTGQRQVLSRGRIGCVPRP